MDKSQRMMGLVMKGVISEMPEGIQYDVNQRMEEIKGYINLSEPRDVMALVLYLADVDFDNISDLIDDEKLVNYFEENTNEPA